MIELLVKIIIITAIAVGITAMVGVKIDSSIVAVCAITTAIMQTIFYFVFKD